MRKHPLHIRNKWAKLRVLLAGGEAISSYVPETRLMNQQSLTDMLSKYRVVYVKPVNGMMGKGVMKVEVLKKTSASGGREDYRYYSGTKMHSFRGFNSAYSSLMKAAGRKPYLVQQGIPLRKHGGRPFDIRLMVQMSPRMHWKVTGAAGRVASYGKVVTNGSQGGTIYPVHVLVKSSERAKLLSTMNRIGILSVKRLHAVYPGIREVGLDIGLDREYRPWILEANTRPDPCPFTKLPNLSPLRRMVQYGKAYGRHYKLHCVKARRGVR